MPSAVELAEIRAPDSHPDLLLSACELMCRVWPKPDRTPEVRLARITAEFAAHPPAAPRPPRAWVATEGGRVVGHAAIVSREIELAGRRVVIAGLARVCTEPECRGRGIGERLVRAAFVPVDSGEFAWSLFQTTPDVRPFYERLGARAIDNRVINSLGDDPAACPFWDPVLMRYPGSGQWPDGVIDLRGPGY